MATCCPSGALGYLAADHDDEGAVKSVDGVFFYQVGSGPRGLLFLPDIWGWNGGRTRAMADDFAKRGLSVYVPKICQPSHEGGTDGDGVAPTFDVKSRGSELGPLFKGDWNVNKVLPAVQKVIGEMKAAGVKKMGVIGVCYGAWIGMYVAKDCPIDLVACVAPHPSVHIEGMVGGVPADLGKTSTCPWAFLPAGKPADGGDPDIYDVDGLLYKALEEKFPGKNLTKRFEAMAHGFVARGHIKEGEVNIGRGDDVKAAVQEAIDCMLVFFVKNGLTSRAKANLPPPLTKPRWSKVGKIQPDSKGLNLKGKVLKCQEVTNESGPKIWEVVIGDDTGVVTVSLRSSDIADQCKVGESVRVQNARVVMVKGFVRVAVDKWAVLRPLEEKLDLEVKEDKDMSATEYELTS